MKIGITVNICANAFLNNVSAAGLVPTLGPVSAELGIPITLAANLMAYNVLAQGLGNIIWVPTMLCFGKRWTILGSSIIFIPCIAWCATAHSYGSLLAARIITGFASGASETFAPAIIGDIWYEHSLTTALGFFTLCTLAGAGLGHAALGYVTLGVGWRWAYWVTLIAAALNFLTMFFFLPETTYARGLEVGVTAGDVERSDIAGEDGKLPQIENVENAENSPQTQSQIADRPGEPFKMSQNLWFIRHPHVNYQNNWFRCFVRPFQFFLSPTVLWASLAYSVTAGAFTAIGVCVPQLTQGPPYNFNTGAQGLFGLSALVGVFLGGTIGSKIVDTVNERAEKKRFRRGADHKPEERIIMLILPFITGGTGLVMYGVTIQKGLPWIAPSVGYTMFSFGLAILGSITFSYIVDSYLVRSGEALVFNNMLRAVVSFGFTSFMPKWIVKVGPAEAYSVLAAINWGVVLIAIPVYIYGPRLRKMTNHLL